MSTLHMLTQDLPRSILLFSSLHLLPSAEMTLFRSGMPEVSVRILFRNVPFHRVLVVHITKWNKCMVMHLWKPWHKPTSSRFQNHSGTKRRSFIFDKSVLEWWEMAFDTWLSSISILVICKVVQICYTLSLLMRFTVHMLKKPRIIWPTIENT